MPLSLAILIFSVSVCSNKADLAFLVDSSGSVEKEAYSKVLKDFRF